MTEMTEYSEDPFQMDEDFDGDFKEIENQTEVERILNENHLLEEIRSPYNNDMKYNTMYHDNELIRSKVAQIKLQEANMATNNNTTEEDEEVYDEDLYDKFDPELQKKLEQDYEQQLRRQNKVDGVKDGESTLNNIVQYGNTDGNIELLTPPENFAPVINRIYRSSFPQPQNFTFLKKLKLKSILCLIPEDYPELNQTFLRDQGIKLFQLGMSGNKEPFVKISSELITEAVKIVINPENQPILIHCNRGKHRTGCLVGVLRRLQKWSMAIIFDEYRKFAAPKERPMDQQFIELYDERDIVNYAIENDFLPLRWD